MKKVLIISHSMNIGGAEKALLGLLSSFDYENYCVDLFLCRHEGEFIQFIPKNVNLLPANQSEYLAIPMKALIKKKKWKIVYGRLKAKILAKIKTKSLNLSNNNQVELLYSHKYTYKYFDSINPHVEYDLAISFLTPHYICANKCKAKKKIAWIHTDYATIDLDIDSELEMWNPFDYIISISDQCTQSFLLKMPTLEKKIVRIDNIITNEMIIEQSELFQPTEMKANNNELIFCSIGRFCNAKNFDNIPNICKRLLQLGIKIKWYIIGYGGDEKLIISKIREENMQSHVIILGKKVNPYPYIKKCDFYLQPSRYEGKSVSVREAQILHKLVIITNYPTANSQLENGIDGVIVPMDNEGCAKGILNFLQNVELQKKILTNLNLHDYSNSSEIKKIYKLMENKL